MIAECRSACAKGESDDLTKEALLGLVKLQHTALSLSLAYVQRWDATPEAFSNASFR